MTQLCNNFRACSRYEQAGANSGHQPEATSRRTQFRLRLDRSEHVMVLTDKGNVLSSAAFSAYEQRYCSEATEQAGAHTPHARTPTRPQGHQETLLQRQDAHRRAAGMDIDRCIEPLEPRTESQDLGRAQIHVGRRHPQSRRVLRPEIGGVVEEVRTRCIVPTCDALVRNRGWCGHHYYRFMRQLEVHVRVRGGITITARFKQLVEHDPATGCWNWIGTSDKRTGRGFFQIHDSETPMIASRAAWRIYRGSIPAGKFVLHRCDNQRCVCPEHLFLGTHQTNMDDMVAKGRSLCGERNRQAKLTEDAVNEIRSSALNQPELAAKYGVTQTTISKVQLRRAWKHV